MDDDPATAEIAGKMHDLLDGEYVGITTIAPVTYDNDEDGAGDVRAWH